MEVWSRGWIGDEGRGALAFAMTGCDLDVSRRSEDDGRSFETKVGRQEGMMVGGEEEEKRGKDAAVY